MKKLAKLAIAAALLSAAFLTSTPSVDACLRACTIKCIPGAHCEITNGCAHCVPNNL